MRPPTNDSFEFGRGHGKVPRNACEIPAVDIAKLAHLPPVIEPVAEQIDGAFDDRVGFGLGCHGALPNVLNWHSMPRKTAPRRCGRSNDVKVRVAARREGGHTARVVSGKARCHAETRPP